MQKVSALNTKEFFFIFTNRTFTIAILPEPEKLGVIILVLWQKL
jgi:hypothetical protein